MTGIIDGTGSLGTALGQLIIGITEAHYGWEYGYLLVISIDLTLCIIPLTKVCIEDVYGIIRSYKIDKRNSIKIEE